MERHNNMGNQQCQIWMMPKRSKYVPMLVICDYDYIGVIPIQAISASYADMGRTFKYKHLLLAYCVMAKSQEQAYELAKVAANKDKKHFFYEIEDLPEKYVKQIDLSEYE
jgi:hypothetical protein